MLAMQRFSFRRLMAALCLCTLIFLAGCDATSDSTILTTDYVYSQGGALTPVYMGGSPLSYYGTVAGGNISYYYVFVPAGPSSVGILDLERDADLSVHTFAISRENGLTFVCGSALSGTTTERCDLTSLGEYFDIHVESVEAGGTSFTVTVD